MKGHRKPGIGLAWWIVALVLLAASTCHAFMTPKLGQQDYSALAADIRADATLAAAVAGNLFDQIETAYNAVSTPDFYVWRTSVPPEEYTGANSLVWTEVDGLSAGKARIFEWITGGLLRPFNPSDPDVLAGIQEAFPAATEARLMAISKKKATRAQKLFATTTGGNGAVATPALMRHDGLLSQQEISYALLGGTMP